MRSGEIAFGREYVGPAHKPRLIAHVAANDLLFDQAGVQGLAHSRLAFVSDRLGSFREPTGSVRRVKEIFAADYDGANEQRVTADGDLDMTPAWSPDGGAIAYTSFRRRVPGRLHHATPDGRQDALPGARGQNRLPAWAPDGTRIAFSSNRDGNEEIYVMNLDGSGGAAVDRPLGHRHRAGLVAGRPSDRLHVGPHRTAADLGDGRRRRKPAAADVGEVLRPAVVVAGAGRRDCLRVADDDRVRHQGDRARHGGRAPADGGRQNESPAFAPNGRHIAFTSTRGGTSQIWVMTRTGAGLRQVTSLGSNSMPAWSGKPAPTAGRLPARAPPPARASHASRRLTTRVRRHTLQRIQRSVVGKLFGDLRGCR